MIIIGIIVFCESINSQKIFIDRFLYLYEIELNTGDCSCGSCNCEFTLIDDWLPTQISGDGFTMTPEKRMLGQEGNTISLRLSLSLLRLRTRLF